MPSSEYKPHMTQTDSKQTCFSEEHCVRFLEYRDTDLMHTEYDKRASCHNALGCFVKNVPSAPFSWSGIRFHYFNPNIPCRWNMQSKNCTNARPYLSLAMQYCCKRQRRVRHINMKKNNHIRSPTATNYYRRGSQRKPVSEKENGRRAAEKLGLIDIPYRLC